MNLTVLQRLGIAFAAINPTISRPKCRPWSRAERSRQRAIKWLMFEMSILGRD